MADKVVKLDDVHKVEHQVRGDTVVVKFSGRAGGKKVRFEIALDAWGLQYAVGAMRAGTKEQVDSWARAQKVLGVDG